MDHLELVGRVIDMAFGALAACVICGAVSTGTAFGVAAALGVANFVFDRINDDCEGDY